MSKTFEEPAPLSNLQFNHNGIARVGKIVLCQYVVDKLHSWRGEATVTGKDNFHQEQGKLRTANKPASHVTERTVYKESALQANKPKYSK